MDMQMNASVNVKHKDRLFRFIFKDKGALLTLYNAVNESDYTDVDALEIYTMENFVYMGMKNDLSFLIDWNMNVFEHQSTYNPNMPLRGFLYMAAAFKRYIELQRLDLYGSKELRLPVPRYYVFYNGLKDMADEEILYLTDSMADAEAPEKSCAQFAAHMVNINKGRSPGIMQRCPLLYEYSLFIAEVRKRTTQNWPLKEAVEEAVEHCIAHNILADILRANKAEVTNMCLEEYDEAFHIASEKEISFEEGRLEGLKSAEKERLRAEKEQLRAEIFKQKLRGETEESIAESQGITLDEVQKILEEI
ncbi:hypothetical protein [Frisingicoccus sp.]|uniref:hypothetical protein n=1 Tax=Frisingicoccus sp. TaxID=1918627 RepID=UPI003AB2FC16